jgi:formylmethanofuran dehydrogenase subunit B
MLATCLGCGCTCDDIDVVVKDGRVVDAHHACSLGAVWFSDGAVPSRIQFAAAGEQRSGDLGAAIATAAAVLGGAGHPLVYASTDLSCEAQREALSLADQLAASFDSVTSSTALPSIAAAQRRGRISATLGEIRNRADVVLFWGVDPGDRYPRYASRYTPDPEGLFVPKGRRSRTVIAVDVGTEKSIADADFRSSVAASEEIDALALLRCLIAGTAMDASRLAPLLERLTPIADRLRRGAYVAIVADGEPQQGRDPRRSEALLLLAEALNGPTRCALSTLRAGGNRTGTDAVSTWQTGFPMAIEFGGAGLRYDPRRGAAGLLTDGIVDAVLVAGTADAVPVELRAAIGACPSIVVGPRASESPFKTVVAIDTGVAGIHTSGTAVRLDDVPVPLRAPLSHPHDAGSVLRGIAASLLARSKA